MRDHETSCTSLDSFTASTGAETSTNGAFARTALTPMPSTGARSRRSRPLLSRSFALSVLRRLTSLHRTTILHRSSPRARRRFTRCGRIRLGSAMFPVHFDDPSAGDPTWKFQLREPGGHPSLEHFLFNLNPFPSPPPGSRRAPAACTTKRAMSAFSHTSLPQNAVTTCSPAKDSRRLADSGQRGEGATCAASYARSLWQRRVGHRLDDCTAPHQAVPRARRSVGPYSSVLGGRSVDPGLGVDRSRGPSRLRGSRALRRRDRAASSRWYLSAWSRAGGRRSRAARSGRPAADGCSTAARNARGSGAVARLPARRCAAVGS